VDRLRAAALADAGVSSFAAEQTAEYLTARPTIVREIEELREVLEDRVASIHSSEGTNRAVSSWSVSAMAAFIYNHANRSI